jgi:hypothetical protein
MPCCIFTHCVHNQQFARGLAHQHFLQCVTDISGYVQSALSYPADRFTPQLTPVQLHAEPRDLATKALPALCSAGNVAQCARHCGCHN